MSEFKIKGTNNTKQLYREMRHAMTFDRDTIWTFTDIHIHMEEADDRLSMELIDYIEFYEDFIERRNMVRGIDARERSLTDIL